MCVNHDPVMTLTDLDRFYGKVNIGHIIMQKTVKMTLNKKTSRKWASGQNIYEFEKEMNPSRYSDSILGLYTCI